MVVGFINHLQVVTTSNYNIISDFHTTKHSTLDDLILLSLVLVTAPNNGYSFTMFSLPVSWQRIYNTGIMKVSLNYTLPLSLDYSTCKVTH
jgi:hypothetical protein